jgi:hypothetical protein
MKVSGYSFPHPVLGLGDDIDGYCDASFLIDYDDANKYIITVNYVLDNATLSMLLSEKKTKYVCEISCSTTIFRKCFESISPIQKIELPKSSLVWFLAFYPQKTFSPSPSQIPRYLNPVRKPRARQCF